MDMYVQFAKVLLVCALLWICVVAMAVPANPKPFFYTQPNGTKILLTLVGDEHAHVYLNKNGQAVEIGRDGYVEVVAEAGHDYLMAKRSKALRDQEEKNKGRLMCLPKAAMGEDTHGLIILVNFSDMKFTNTREYIHNQMNIEGYDLNGATGSARDYFIAQSSGVFCPTFDVVGPVDLDMPYRYYGGNLANGSDRHPDTMVFSAVQKAAEGGLDLKEYDMDNDGIVDMVYIIYAGLGEADGGDESTIWPHMWNLQASAQFAYQQINSKRIGLYACSAEFRGDGTFSGIGTFCHEYGHSLGLPDTYDVSYNGGYGMGNYDVMSHGSYLNNGNTPPNYSGFERYSVGWLTYDDAISSREVALLPLDESNTAIRLSSPDNPNEYFVLENRQQQGWDAYLPARGLMITHIDYDKDVWDKNAVNTDKNHQHVKIMAADNVWNKSTQSGDLYPGLLNNTEFSETSTPNSNLWNGLRLGKNVTNISMSGSEVNFHIDVDPTGIYPTGFVNSKVYLPHSIYNVIGQQVQTGYHGLIIVNGKKSSISNSN